MGDFPQVYNLSLTVNYLLKLLFRQNPYAGRDPMSVAIDVLHRGLRPTIANSIDPNIRSKSLSQKLMMSNKLINYTGLITACWSQKPSDRPSFQEIMTTLRGLTAHAPVQSYDTSAAVRVDAPSGMVYLIATVCFYVIFYDDQFTYTHVGYSWCLRSLGCCP